MALADHIFVNRLGYTHHGIDLGDGRVIHYTGEVAQKSEARIRASSIDEFAAGGQVRVREYGECDPPEVVAERARQRLHEDDYSLIFNNCEHFATWCKTGRHESEQVEDLTSVAGGAVLVGSAAAGSVGVVGATGAGKTTIIKLLSRLYDVTRGRNDAGLGPGAANRPVPRRRDEWRDGPHDAGE